MDDPDYFIGPPREGYFPKHSINWKDGTKSVTIELSCFREKMAGRIPINHGGVGASWHFKNIAMALWPENRTDGGPKFIWNAWADRMLRKACTQNYLAIAGSGGFGKSEFFAIWLIVNFLCDPANTMCLATSMTVSVSKKKLWGKVTTFWVPLEELGFPGKLVDSLHIIRYVDGNGIPIKGDMAGIALVVGERKKEKEAVGRLLGIHQERVIFVADDLTELSEAVTEAAIYNMSRGCTFFQFVGIANPYSYFDPFGKFAAPKDGWQSITVEDEEWETERGICIHFDALKNPRITEGDDRLVWMDTQEAINKEIDVHGGNSSSFWRMYRGFWCPTGVQELIYSEAEIINCGADQKADWMDEFKNVRACFLDPAFSSDGDRTVAYLGTYGKQRNNVPTLQYDEFFIFKDDVLNKTATRSEQVIYWFKSLCEKNNVPPRNAGFDSTGAGGPFGDLIDILWSKEVYRISFAGAASKDRSVSAYDSATCNERYYNKVSELWYRPKESMRAGQIKGLHPDAIRELCMRKKVEKIEAQLLIRAESKRDMMLRTEHSPDLADAAVGLFDLCCERLGLSSGSVTRQMYPQKHTKPFKQILRKWDAFADIKRRNQPNPFDLLSQ